MGVVKYSCRGTTTRISNYVVTYSCRVPRHEYLTRVECVEYQTQQLGLYLASTINK